MLRPPPIAAPISAPISGGMSSLQSDDGQAPTQLPAHSASSFMAAPPAARAARGQVKEEEPVDPTELALMMDFTNSAPAGRGGEDLLAAPSADLHDSLPDAPSRDDYDRTVSSLYRDLSGDGGGDGGGDGEGASGTGRGASSLLSGMPSQGQVFWSASEHPKSGAFPGGGSGGGSKRSRAPEDRGARVEKAPKLGPYPSMREVWWWQDLKTKSWREYDARDTALLEDHYSKMSQPGAGAGAGDAAPAAAVQRPRVQCDTQHPEGKYAVNLVDMLQPTTQSDSPACRVRRQLLQASDITELPRSKDMLPKPAGPAVAGLLFEIARHPELKRETGLSLQTLPSGAVALRLDLSGKERNEPDIEEKGNCEKQMMNCSLKTRNLVSRSHKNDEFCIKNDEFADIAELLSSVFLKIGKSVDFGCSGTKEDQAKAIENLPLAVKPKCAASMLALLGPGATDKSDVRTVRVQRCVDAQNNPVYKRTIFKWAAGRNGGSGKWRRQKRWDSVRKHLSDPVLIPTRMGAVRIQFWSNETGGGQKEGDFSQVYTERSGGARDRQGSLKKRGGIDGSFQRCAELLKGTRRFRDNCSWKELFDAAVREKLLLSQPIGAIGGPQPPAQEPGGAGMYSTTSSFIRQLLAPDLGGDGGARSAQPPVKQGPDRELPAPSPKTAGAAETMSGLVSERSLNQSNLGSGPRAGGAPRGPTKTDADEARANLNEHLGGPAALKRLEDTAAEVRKMQEANKDDLSMETVTSDPRMDPDIDMHSKAAGFHQFGNRGEPGPLYATLSGSVPVSQSTSPIGALEPIERLPKPPPKGQEGVDEADMSTI